MVPGVRYSPDKDDPVPADDMTNWFRRNEAKWKYYQAHPDGPYMYSEWGRYPRAPGIAPLMPAGSNAINHWRKTGPGRGWKVWDSDLFRPSASRGVVASVFANREIHLVVANYGSAEARIVTADSYLNAGRSRGPGRERNGISIPDRCGFFAGACEGFSSKIVHVCGKF